MGPAWPPIHDWSLAVIKALFGLRGNKCLIFERFFKQNGAQQLFKADGEGRAKKTWSPERDRASERREEGERDVEQRGGKIKGEKNRVKDDEIGESLMLPRLV